MTDRDFNAEFGGDGAGVNCCEQLEDARRQAEDYKDKYLRAAAEAQNVRRWTERDVTSRHQESQRDLLRRLLEVVDNLERALSQPAEAETLRQGVQLTLRQLEGILARAGVERMEVEPGAPFDPAYQEAVELRPGDLEEPTVMEVVQPGYVQDGAVLRPARVVVMQ
jgi:molecular chaperone GrpE